MSITTRVAGVIAGALAATTIGAMLTAPAQADAFGWRFNMINVTNPTEGPKMLAGSTGNQLAFGFLSGGPGPTLIQAQIPGVARGTSWTPPQATDPAAPGFVRVGKGSCTSAELKSIENPSTGVWFINALVDCPANTTFGIFYGSPSGGTKVTAPSRAAQQPFVATVQPPGAAAPAVIGVSLVTVTPGKATSILIQTKQAVALVDKQLPPRQPVIIQAVDALGNRDMTWNGAITMSYSGSRGVFTGDLPKSFTLTRGLVVPNLTFPINDQFPYAPALTRVTAKSADGTLSGSTMVRVLRKRAAPTVASSVNVSGGITVGPVTLPPNTPLTVTGSSIAVDGTQTLTVVPTSNPTSTPLSFTTGTLVLTSGANSTVAPAVNPGAQITVTGCIPPAGSYNTNAPPPCPATQPFNPVVVVNLNAAYTGPAVSPIAVLVNVTTGVLNPQ